MESPIATIKLLPQNYEQAANFISKIKWEVQYGNLTKEELRDLVEFGMHSLNILTKYTNTIE